MSKRRRSSSVLLGLWSVMVLQRAAGEEPSFLRGDANADGKVSVSDAVMLHRYLYQGGSAPTCLDTADVNNDGWSVDIADQSGLFLAILGRFSIFPPFPTPGFDPDPDHVSCDSYVVEPAPHTDDILRLGNVAAGPGDGVEVPVYLTSTVEVEAIQIVLRYDPLVFTPTTGVGGPNLDFEGTHWSPRAALEGVAELAPEGILVVTAIGRPPGPDLAVGSPIPPGHDQLIFRLKGKVAAEAPVGTEILLEPTNGPDGEGVGATYLRNEITHQGRARYTAVLPGVLTVVNEPPPPPPPPPGADSAFLRGDANADGRISISDTVTINRFIFDGGLEPPCLDAADVNDSGNLDLSDEIVILADAFWRGRLLLLPPFPTLGLDPTPDNLSCLSYVVEPAPRTDDLIRIGDVTAGPGEAVEIPVFLSTTVEVEAIQVVLRYDPSVFLPIEDRRGQAFSFSGTTWEPRPEFASVLVLEPEGLLLAGVAGSLASNLTPPIPPGDDQLVFKLKGQVAPGAEPGTEILIKPDNGPAGEGVRPPLFLLNEITHQGEARHVSFLPRLEAGVLAIVGDVTFFRGDANSDRTVDMSDAVFTLGFLFLGGPQPLCPDAADADDNGKVEITDAVAVLGQLFLGLGSISPPHPERGPDPTADQLPRCRGG